MEKKYILLSMEDEKLKTVAEVLSNKTSKKIIDFLSTKDASENDISQFLKIPINTVEYNLKKLTHAGLVEKTKEFFWSKKGKKIPMYKLSNKSIVISPKATKINSAIKQILPVALISGIAMAGLKFYFDKIKTFSDISQDSTVSLFAAEASTKVAETATIAGAQNYWLWFGIGSLFTLFIFTIVNVILNLKEK